MKERLKEIQIQGIQQTLGLVSLMTQGTGISVFTEYRKMSGNVDGFE
jgi:hypothetical protein